MEDCNKMDYYNETLTIEQISECIEFYNLETFGVTHKDCKSGKCLTCKDIAKCQNGARKRSDLITAGLTEVVDE